MIRLYYKEGDIAKVHSPLFAVEDDDAVSATPAPPARQTAQSKAPAPEADTNSKTTAAGNTPDTKDTTPAKGTPSRDFILPDIGEGIVECEVVTWRIQEGDDIEEDQPVVDVMTDKALVEITAPEAGRVVKRYYQQEDNAKVHSPLFAYVPRDAESNEGSAQSAGSADIADTEAGAPTEADQPVNAARASGPRHRIPASPAVRRLVREQDLNLSDIPGSGKDGRVLKEDILRFQKQAPSGGTQQPASATTAGAARTSATDEVRVEPLRGVRAVMARRMAESASTIPHFTFGDEVDVTALLALRQQLKPRAEEVGVRLTLMPFIMKALALAVTRYPILNSRLNDEVSEIHYQPHVNIGMAVDTPTGLIVPNIKRTEQLSVLEIAQELERLVKAARDGQVRQEDLRDGTISISNIGALGGTYASPIISKPEVAIVALGRTQSVPRFNDLGEVVARDIMNISWSGDHRIIDGGTIARFSNLWKAYLEDPSSMLLHLS